MDSCVGETAVIDNIHADPDIDTSENSLMIIFVIFGMVQKYSVKEVVFFDGRRGLHLNGVLTVAAQGGLLFLKSSGQH